MGGLPEHQGQNPSFELVVLLCQDDHGQQPNEVGVGRHHLLMWRVLNLPIILSLALELLTMTSVVLLGTFKRLSTMFAVLALVISRYGELMGPYSARS